MIEKLWLMVVWRDNGDLGLVMVVSPVRLYNV